jgi:hypothetical protein
MVGVVKTQAAWAYLRSPPTKCLPKSDISVLEFADMKAFLPVVSSISDWCKCQPLEEQLCSATFNIMSGQTAIIKEPRTQPGPPAVRVPQAGGVLHELWVSYRT